MLKQLQRNGALFQPQGHCGEILSKEANANGSCRDKQLGLKNSYANILHQSFCIIWPRCIQSVVNESFTVK